MPTFTVEFIIVPIDVFTPSANIIPYFCVCVLIVLFPIFTLISPYVFFRFEFVVDAPILTHDPIIELPI